MKVNIRERARKNEVVYEYYFTYKGQRYSKSGYKTAKKAEKAGSIILAELMVNSPQNMTGGNMPLSQLITEFFDVVQYRYAQATLRCWSISLKRLSPDILKMPINNIKYNTIQTYFNKNADRTYWSNEHVRVPLCRVFEYAIRMKYINESPMNDVRVFGEVIEHRRTYVTQEQFDLIINEISNNNRLGYLKQGSMIIALKLGFFLGLRVGEVFALEKKDFDLENKTVSINKTLVYSGLKKEEYYAKSGAKTDASNDVLYIPDSLIDDLKKWFEINPTHIVCPDYNCGYMCPFSFDTYFNSRSKKVYGFNFNFHMLRHSFAQRLVDHNIDAKTAQELMRHVSFNTTMQYYVHSSDEKKINALNIVS